jgi:prepilin peptidase CpaA
MHLPIDGIRWAIILLTCAALTFAGVSDVRHRRIPNSAVLAIIALFAGWYLAGPSVSLQSSLIAALVVFVCGFLLYVFKVVGAGDSKLAAAVALFVGLHGLPQFLFYMALAGGVMALCMLVAQPASVSVMLHTRGRGQVYRGVPYGVAIAISGVMTLLMVVRPHF